MRRVGEEPSLAAASARYAALGVPVFPCVPGGKQPLTSHGFRDATTSPQRVHDWWARTPRANIGLPTGAGSGLVVVDVDVHDAGSGYGAFERARSSGLTDGWGWLVRTPSGGLHAYYAHHALPAYDTYGAGTPQTEQRSWQAPGAHVDFRGDGGYVVAPPSGLEIDQHQVLYGVIATSRHPMRYLDSHRLREFLQPPRTVPSRPLQRWAAGPDRPVSGVRPDKLAEWVASRPEGARNGGLFWAACRMVENGHDYHDSLAVLGAAAQSAGLREPEIASTISSAYRIASRLSPTHASDAASRVGPTRPSEGIAL